MEAYRWVDASPFHGTFPSTAMQGGIDIDGHEIYVGRAYFGGDWLPAKIIPGKNVAYVGHGGEEHEVNQFQVLCEQRFQWIPTHGSNIPDGAVEGGRTSEGENLYIGRVVHDGAQTIGKVHPSHAVCYVPFDGKEIGFTYYEILVLRL